MNRPGLFLITRINDEEIMAVIVTFNRDEAEALIDAAIATIRKGDLPGQPLSYDLETGLWVLVKATGVSEEYVNQELSRGGPGS
jgi:hypothetical protein